MTLSPRLSRVIIFTLILLASLTAGLLFFSDRDSDLTTGDSMSGKPEKFAATANTLIRIGDKTEEAASSSALNLLFFGDLMLDRHIGEKLSGRHLDYLLGDLASSTPEFFVGYDLIGANLEGAVTSGGAHYSPVMAYDFAFTPERVGELKKYGFNFFNIANNHITDQGERGLTETREELMKLEVDYSGAADAVVDANSVKIIERSGQRIVLIGLSMVYRDFDLLAATALIQEAKKNTDLVIVNIHWGTEYQHQFNKQQQKIGHTLIDAGADIVIGHHPHVVQGMELYKGKPIFYSLGNFIFDQYFSADTQQGLAVGLKLTDDKISATLFPLQAKAAVINLMVSPDKDSFLLKYADWSLGDEDFRALIKSQLIEIKR